MVLPSNKSGVRPKVVIGLGNEIVHDDGVGIAAARRLGRLLAHRHDTDVIALPWAGFALLDALVGRRHAVLIDSLLGGSHPPGTIVRLDEHDIRGSVRLVSFHDIAFPTVLTLGRRMGYALPETIAIWAVEAQRVDTFGVGLSPPVAAALPRLVDEVYHHLERPDARTDMALTAAAGSHNTATFPGAPR